MKHRCVANGCKKMLPGRYLMCATHWARVPLDLQRAVYAAYVPGQTIATASGAWKQAVEQAIAAVDAAGKGGS